MVRDNGYSQSWEETDGPEVGRKGFRAGVAAFFRLYQRNQIGPSRCLIGVRRALRPAPDGVRDAGKREGSGHEPRDQHGVVRRVGPVSPSVRKGLGEHSDTTAHGDSCHHAEPDEPLEKPTGVSD